MATGNRLKIRHGTGTPTTSNLLPYELGWNGEGLYINNAASILKLFGSTMSFDDITIGNLIVTGGASFTNIPMAPTAATGTNNTQLATTAFVTGAINNIDLDYLPLTGGTLSGPVTTSSTFNMGGGNFKIKYGAIAPSSASLENTDIYFYVGDPSGGGGSGGGVIPGTGLTLTANGTLNHSNAVSLQTVQAVYPIQIDTEGHISAYGDAITYVSGVKGNSESSYRTGNVNITKSNIGLGNVENKTSATIRSELTSANVTSALGFTPYNSTNPNGYTANGNSRIFYGTCDTAAATANKTVICADYDSLQAGDILNVKFANTNTAAVANLTLNVNNTGAISIKKAYNYAIANLSAKAELNADVLCMFVYNVNSDSTSNWILCNLDYNTNTNTLLRTYSSATNIEVPLIAQSSAASTTAAWTTYTDTSKDWYGVIPNVDNIRAKINLSTGHITVPGGVTSVTPTTGDNSTLVATTAFVNTAINNAIGAAIGGSY